MVKPINDQQLALWKAFLRTYAQIVPELEREMQAKQNIPLTWYEVLAQLNCSAEGGLRMQDLAAGIILSQSGLTRLLDRMSEAGLVERHRCPHDRRGWYATITPQGKTLLENATPIHLEGVKEYFMQYLSDEEVLTLLNTFEKVLNAKQ